MASVLSGLSYLVAFVVTLPIVVVFTECMLAIFSSRSNHPRSIPKQPKIAILIPAHNESEVISKTLKSLLPQLDGSERVVVIADNCSDDTAELARSFNVEVIERTHATNRGKGYALDFGLSHLESDAPDIVVMLDADCIVEAGGVAKIATASFESNRPVQAVYLQNPPKNPSANDMVSTFAFLVKNLVRPTGLDVINQPCLLTGTGMAFPWQIIRDAPLASGNIVEDMQLGLDLAIEGHAPKLVPDALVWGDLPQQTAAATTQRTRWEHGHIQTLTSQVPRLLKSGLQQKRIGLIALGLDLLVPPLALLVIMWVISGAITLFFGIIGASRTPAKIVGSAGVLLFGAIGGSWARFGRKTLPLQILLSVPFYIAWKVPVYLGYLFKRQTDWVRTERDSV